MEINRLQYRIEVMQKVIRQFERKYDKIRLTTEATIEYQRELYELGGAYLECEVDDNQINQILIIISKENECAYETE